MSEQEEERGRRGEIEELQQNYQLRKK